VSPCPFHSLSLPPPAPTSSLFPYTTLFRSPRNRADPAQGETSRLQEHGLSFGIAKLFLSAHTVANQEKQSSDQAEACDVSEDHAKPWGIISDDTHANHPHKPATSEQDHKPHKYPEQHQQRL